MVARRITRPQRIFVGSNLTGCSSFIQCFFFFGGGGGGGSDFIFLFMSLFFLFFFFITFLFFLHFLSLGKWRNHSVVY